MTPLRLRLLVALLLLLGLLTAPGREREPVRRASTSVAPVATVVERPQHQPRASRSRRTSPPPAPPRPRPKTRPKVVPTAVVVDPASARGAALRMVLARGWSAAQFGCLDALWGGRESGWRTDAGRTSGPYGIPQANPGTKMASAGADWRTSATTQIAWGLGYIARRYGTPCAALAHSRATLWY